MQSFAIRSEIDFTHDRKELVCNLSSRGQTCLIALFLFQIPKFYFWRVHLNFELYLNATLPPGSKKRREMPTMVTKITAPLKSDSVRQETQTRQSSRRLHDSPR